MNRSDSQAADRSTHVAPKVYLTAAIPPIGGLIKQRPEDFLVDELPAYAPCGEGEHIYMLITKRMMSTMQMLDVLAKHFKVRSKDIGYAGLKDKHAITRQVVSIYAPGKKIEDFPMLQHEAIGVNWADYHTNKLRPGHLTGNRFSIKIRNVNPMHVRHALACLKRLQTTGVPNRIGEQRFGMIGNNHLIGRAIIMQDYAAAVRELLGPSTVFPHFNAEARELFTQGKYREAIMAYPHDARTECRVLNQLAQGRSERDAILSLDDTTIRFYLTAFQSAVFNAVLDERLAAGTLATLHEGDVALKHENHAVFLVDAATLATDGVLLDAQGLTTQPLASRVASFEVSPSGPMWGSRMLQATHAAGDVERRCLAALGVTPEDIARHDTASRWPLEGKRRPLRVPITDPEVEGGVDEHGAYIRCAFELPRGSFATVVMRELMKPAEALTDDDMNQ
ncbi:MAG: tRNA pseudouridine(13) synthase TruD [Phycisphaerae bacterium]|jgi:tRNA pseudouridine13 synthase